MWARASADKTLSVGTKRPWAGVERPDASAKRARGLAGDRETRREGDDALDRFGTLLEGRDERDADTIATRVDAVRVACEKAPRQYHHVLFLEQTPRKDGVVDRGLRPQIERRVRHRAG